MQETLSVEINLSAQFEKTLEVSGRAEFLVCRSLLAFFFSFESLRLLAAGKANLDKILLIRNRAQSPGSAS